MKLIQTRMKSKPKNTIIVADDDPAILDAIKLMLELHDYKVETISDGKVIAEVNRNRPKLLLLDVLMSGVDGREICREIKSHRETQDIPVILISASQDMEQSTEDAGANDFLAKPFDIDELLSKVEHHMTN